MARPLLEIRDLQVGFHTPRGLITPVRGVSLSVFPGQTLAVVGESGCGKSVTAMSVLRLLPSPPSEVLGGRIVYEGVDLLELDEPAMRRVRGKEIAMIFQEPMTSLNPVYTVGDQIAEVVALHQKVSMRQARSVALQALTDVGMPDAQRRLDAYPHELSGGMRQRVMIAMALACRPRVLIADEPTTALDVTIQAQILELLRAIQQRSDMATILITHDLGVVAENADVVAVMYAGRVVEFATVDDLFANPMHPYTQGLFRALPRMGSGLHRLETIEGQVPNPASLPTGCKFHPRCRMMRGDALCAKMEPPLREVGSGHWAACHHVDNFTRWPITVPVSVSRRDQPVEPRQLVVCGNGGCGASYPAGSEMCPRCGAPAGFTSPAPITATDTLTVSPDDPAVSGSGDVATAHSAKGPSELSGNTRQPGGEDLAVADDKHSADDKHPTEDERSADDQSQTENNRGADAGDTEVQS